MDQLLLGQAAAECLVDSLGEHLIFVIIGLVFMTGMVIKGITRIVTDTSHERTRREIAAYIAEGSMTPEQGERLLRDDKRRAT